MLVWDVEELYSTGLPNQNQQVVSSIGALLGSVSDTGTGSLLEKMHLLFTGPCTRKRPL